ncbi:MAG: diguanylate cyclase domain-containing protein [Roseburia sp.]
MKKRTTPGKDKKIVITLLLMLALVGVSVVVSWHISQAEEQACWESLHQSVSQVASEMETRIDSDRELLECVADIIIDQDYIDSPEVQKIIDGFQPNTMISHIALLLPGDQVMLPNEPVRDTQGILSFEKEAALGRHISDRSVDIRDENRLILRNFVPVIKDGETIAMLYGVVDLSTLPDQLKNTGYDGQEAIYVIDGNTGNFIMDTWHNSLGNIEELGDREAKRGYSQEQLKQDVLDGKTGYCVFVSKTIGEYLYFYYEPVSINRWMVGISVPESVAFSRVKKVNALLMAFIAAEIALLAVYFAWMLQSTKKELHEKQKLAETDVLTGLLNRNCYERNLNEYSERCKADLTCIYADANGLHELNNTKGHEAGDRMLQAVARTMQGYFGERDTYRTGGDEFVAFARDERMEQLEDKISNIHKTLTAQGYHVSIGIYRQERPIDINVMIKRAEEQMYEAKKRYYEQTGTDRRKRSLVN